jgi:hypothetical protein
MALKKQEQHRYIDCSPHIWPTKVCGRPNDDVGLMIGKINLNVLNCGFFLVAHASARACTMRAHRLRSAARGRCITIRVNLQKVNTLKSKIFFIVHKTKFLLKK